MLLGDESLFILLPLIHRPWPTDPLGIIPVGTPIPPRGRGARKENRDSNLFLVCISVYLGGASVEIDRD